MSRLDKKTIRVFLKNVNTMQIIKKNHTDGQISLPIGYDDIHCSIYDVLLFYNFALSFFIFAFDIEIS